MIIYYLSFVLIIETVLLGPMVGLCMILNTLIREQLNFLDFLNVGNPKSKIGW